MTNEITTLGAGLGAYTKWSARGGDQATISIPELEAKAKAATQGDWKMRPCSHGGCILIRGSDRHLQHMIQIVPADDADHIAAANPATILALCAELRECKDTLEKCASHTSRTEKVLKVECKAALERLKAMGVV